MRLRPRWFVCPGLVLAVFALPNLAVAQLPQARLSTLHPPGGQKGATFETVNITGVDLDDHSELLFSHPGITAVFKPASGPMPAPAQPQQGRRGRRGQDRAQTVVGQYTITIAPEVPAGQYDVRVRSAFGLSNPRTFVVGERREVLEVEPNNEPAKPQAIELETTVNGRSDGAADVDFYKFAGKAGQRILLDCYSQRIDSRLVPALELYDAAGRKLAWRFGTLDDALLDVTLPADGEYTIRVFDTAYAGSVDHFYRLTVHAGPHVDFAVPSSIVPGTTAEVTLYGRNLPGGQPSPFKSLGKPLDMLKVQVAAPQDDTLLQTARGAEPARAGMDAFTWQLPGANPISLFFATAPAGVEAEPNDTPDKAQTLTLPLEVTGQFQNRADVDVYHFQANAGDIWWMELYGERNSSASDPVLAVDLVKKNDKGEEALTRMVALDDNPTNVGGNLFNSTTDDPFYRFVAPEAGLFRVTVRDRNYESRGDPTLTYRLAIRKETPDFRLVVLPPMPAADQNAAANTWDLSLRKGENVNVVVMAYRRDGYNGVIDVTAEGLPEGVTCSGASIGPNQMQATIVFSASEETEESAGAIKIVGKGRVDDAAAVKALTDAEAARVAAVNALPAAAKTVADMTANLQKVQEAAAKAKEALDKDAANEGLKKANDEAAANIVKAQEALKVATDAKAAADQKVTETNAAVMAALAAKDAAAKTLAREARGGTIIWPGNPGAGQPAQARATRSLTLSVMDEVFPYQLTTDTLRFEVNQSRQVLIPVKLLKRAGFDNAVNLNFVQPLPQNIQLENKPIEKGKDQQVYRIFVQNNAAPGTYTLWQQSQTQVSYRRHPEKEAAAIAEKDVAVKAAATAAETQKKAAEAKTAADKKVADATAAAKKATDEKTAADKKVADADIAAKKAAEEKVAADKLAADTDAAAKKAVEEKVVAEKAATDAEAAAKTAADAAAAAAKAAADKPDDKALADAKVAAEKAAVDAAEAAKKAVEAKVAAEKKVTETAAAAKKAADAKVASDKKATDTAEANKKAAEAKVAADKVVVDTAELQKKATEEKTVADKAGTDADAALKAANDAKAAAEKKATDATNLAKPQNLNAFSPAPSITLVVKQGPGALQVAPANGGALKKGATLEVKVTVARANGFAGPVTLSLPLPPGVTGITAPEVQIPSDKNEGTLVIQAAADATMGQLPNMVIRGSMDFNGPAAVDQPVAINVVQ